LLYPLHSFSGSFANQTAERKIQRATVPFIAYVSPQFAVQRGLPESAYVSILVSSLS